MEMAVEENPRARKKKKPPPGYQFEGENGFAEFVSDFRELLIN